MIKTMLWMGFSLAVMFLLIIAFGSEHAADIAANGLATEAFIFVLVSWANWLTD